MDFTVSAAALPMFLVGFAILLLGIAVFARERANSVTWSFLILTICTSTWLFAVALTASTDDPARAFIFARITYLGVALIPAAVLQFTLALVEGRNRTLLTTTWIIGAIFAVLFTTTRLLLDGVWKYSWGFYPRLREPAVLFLAYFTLVLALSLLFLGTGDTHTDRERRRNAAFFLALCVGYMGSVDYLPAFGLDFYPVGSFAILGFIALSAIAIFRFQLIDLGPSYIANHLLLTMHGGVLVVDTRARVKVANEFAAKLLGYSIDEIRGLDLLSLLDVGRLPAVDSDSFIRNAVTRERVVNWKRRDGTSVEICLSASAVRDKEGDPLGVIYVVSDVSATHDMLTAVPNRTRFSALFEQTKKTIMAAGRIPAILFVDLDGFKSVNDRLGHAAGDELLQLVAKRIRRAIRGEDIVARYGGDEFVVLVDLAKQSDASFVAAKLLRVVGEPYTIDHQYVTIGASIGCAFYPVDGESVDDLMRVADTAMYDAKRSGKGRVKMSRGDQPAPPPFNVNARA
jgi:diguanylate cyclase (GGDEF)-like protein/PAS domain S-box-containing protein